MNQVQLWLDRMVLVSAQRWMFAGLALVAVVGTSLAIGAAGDGQNGIVLALVVGVAAVAISHPDSHVGLILEAIVVWQWLATSDDPASPWSLLVALGLFAFHTLLALLAATPISATVDRFVGFRWLTRTVAVVAAAIGVWVLVILMEGRRPTGSAALGAAAFVALTALALWAQVLTSRLGRDTAG